MEFNENSNRRVYCIDVDGTLTRGEPFWKQEPTVSEEVKEAVRMLYRTGNIIVIHTARQWEMASETVAWLIKNKIPFHGIMMSKGGSDFYVDDKNVPIERIVNMNVPLIVDPNLEEHPPGEVVPIKESRWKGKK